MRVLKPVMTETSPTKMAVLMSAKSLAVAMDMSMRVLKTVMTETSPTKMAVPMGAKWRNAGDGYLHVGAEACDDGNDNNSDRCLTSCEWNLPCGQNVALTCGSQDNWSPGLQEHRMIGVDACHFQLDAPTDEEWASGSDLVDRLVTAVGGSIEISDIFDDLNRSGRRGITNLNATRLENHDYLGFAWNNGDMDVSYWYPQGITGTGDAFANGFIDDRRALIVSGITRPKIDPRKARAYHCLT